MSGSGVKKERPLPYKIRWSSIPGLESDTLANTWVCSIQASCKQVRCTISTFNSIERWDLPLESAFQTYGFKNQIQSEWKPLVCQGGSSEEMGKVSANIYFLQDVNLVYTDEPRYSEHR